MNLFKLIKCFLSGWVPGGKFKCVLCDHSVWKFMPYPKEQQSNLGEALDIIGSDLRNYECPRCGSTDRERHVFLFMESMGILKALKDKRIIHFAPEKRLRSRISALSPSEYVCCDLHPVSSTIQKVDIEEIPFPENSFDLVIANHVLEHVTDEYKAAREIYRILTPSGYAILQTPYSNTLEHTWSDPGIITEEARFCAYGQKDHMRLFGKDVFQKLSSVGLQPCIKKHEELLPEINNDKFGVNRREPFFLFSKRYQTS